MRRETREIFENRFSLYIFRVFKVLTFDMQFDALLSDRGYAHVERRRRRREEDDERDQRAAGRTNRKKREKNGYYYRSLRRKTVLLVRFRRGVYEAYNRVGVLFFQTGHGREKRAV